MIEIKKTAITIDETELIELERIIIDSNTAEALIFLKRSIHHKIILSQQG